ncbi:MAG TPA: helix-turn-helix transcriptional regulator [Polyangiaceae bacterium]|nr:helix-turn-helix transcriptional regulator [Polyangiaceae bacterium]
MAARMTGVLYTYQTHFLYVGALIASSRHQHHAGQVMWVPCGLEIEDEDGAQRQVTGHVVRPDTPHAHGAASAAAVLWVDRDDLQWDDASSSLPGRVRALPATTGARLGGLLAPNEARDVARALLEVVAPAEGVRTRAARHPAVMRMCALLDTTAPERDIRMTQLAQQSGLSLRQLRHRFTEELGINPRSYLRWRRLRRAVTAIERGATLTEAAVTGGFADGAHFSRVFQAQFGMAPSQALSSVHFGGPLA